MPNKINVITLDQITAAVDEIRGNLDAIVRYAEMARKIGVKDVEMMGHAQMGKANFATKQFAKNFSDVLKAEHFDEIVAMGQKEKADAASTRSSAQPPRQAKRSSPRKSG